jgi:hypothetical protein
MPHFPVMAARNILRHVVQNFTLNEYFIRSALNISDGNMAVEK